MTKSSTPREALASDLRRELAQLVDDGRLELPVLSQAALRAASMCRDGTSDARALAETLNHDPALAGHVLRVANSTAYAPVEPIVSLQQSISRLGLNTIGQITFAVAVGSRVFSVAGHESWVREMWHHAALTAGWAREISRVRRRNAESSFLCGLLHDVGWPVLLQAAVDRLARAGLVGTREELAPVLDELHQRAGACLAADWNMPPCVRAAMVHHHDSDAASEHLEETRTTELADLIADWSEGPDTDRVEATIEHLHGLPLAASLCLYEDELATLLGRCERVRDFAGALE